jgi:hypothetical protein
MSEICDEEFISQCDRIGKLSDRAGFSASYEAKFAAAKLLASMPENFRKNFSVVIMYSGGISMDYNFYSGSIEIIIHEDGMCFSEIKILDFFLSPNLDIRNEAVEMIGTVSEFMKKINGYKASK